MQGYSAIPGMVDDVFYLSIVSLPYDDNKEKQNHFFSKSCKAKLVTQLDIKRWNIKWSALITISTCFSLESLINLRPLSFRTGWIATAFSSVPLAGILYSAEKIVETGEGYPECDRGCFNIAGTLWSRSKVQDDRYVTLQQLLQDLLLFCP